MIRLALIANSSIKKTDVFFPIPVDFEAFRLCPFALVFPSQLSLAFSVPSALFLRAKGAWAYWLSNAVVIDPKTKCIAAWVS